MHTVLSRLNTVFAFTLSVLAATTFLCFLTTSFNSNFSPSNLQAGRVLIKNVPDFTGDRDRNDLALLTFDLKANLTDVFNWNVKELFLYVMAEYSSPNNVRNQVFLWDKILLRDENGVLEYKDMNTDYYFFDDGLGLKSNKNISLSLYWQIIPNAGQTPRIRSVSQLVEFPDRYTAIKQ
ncbi:signal peptidase complex subunit 3-like [Corticium candelabrum]|uniref:signal peptidase complex subunit 3-like n=1 Tax=Corticium candelabrum TaxID=121492 RepID=UPI002E26E90B|nr:signal peptidase complex subunit 3-like [Corticium candelabrum]